MKKTIVCLILLLLISFIANYYQFSHSQVTTANTNLADLKKQYPLVAQRALRRQINPTDTPNDLINNFLPLRDNLHKFIDPNKEAFAFYFEYLPTGTSIGINEDTEFTPASLLKVPVVMAYYYKKERLHLTKGPVVTLTPKELNDRFGDLYKKGKGAPLDLDEAAKIALQQSDNTASLALSDYISDDDFQYIQGGLDIPLALKGQTPIITAQQYSSILKALYFSSILTKDDSQDILNMLTHTDFHDMLPSGVPSDIPVAHKIGLVDNQIYSDCGIVYLPQRPYVLCMISQSDRKTAVVRMHTVSKMIYDYISSYQYAQPQ